MRVVSLGILVFLSMGMGPREPAVEIHYSSPTLDWDYASGEALGVRRVQEFDNPVSAVPSRQTSQPLKKTLTAEEVRQFHQALGTLAEAFFALAPDQGAPEIQRHYPYAITLLWQGRSHRVTYRSNPSFPGAPQVFLDLEALVLKTFSS